MIPAFLIAALLMLAPAEVTPDQEARLDATLADLKVMDAELLAIASNISALVKSSAMRREEVASLKLRYPDFKLDDDASVKTIYDSFYDYRMARAQAVKPILEQKMKDTNARYCSHMKELRKGLDEVIQSDAYKRSGLQQRIELRKSMDDALAGLTSKDMICDN